MIDIFKDYKVKLETEYDLDNIDVLESHIHHLGNYKEEILIDMKKVKRGDYRKFSLFLKEAG
jgi:hypothetical protein